MILKPGDVVFVGGAASVQFAGDRAILLRVIAVSGRMTYVGWAWITGYELNAVGGAVCRREVFVQPAGLRRVPGGERLGGVVVAEVAVRPGDVVGIGGQDRRYADER